MLSDIKEDRYRTGMHMGQGKKTVMKRTEMQSTGRLEREINCCGSGFNWVSGSGLEIRILIKKRPAR
jgi:hypothetical protein